ncbi:type I phosphodiesterase [Myxozyma melibiosi]|uniref:Type I phosphodiesterase n=1 Tax=Myxozyma melibiosi TaxID=54550 RepID=A0ABR1F7Y4_9ASCO
MASKRRDSLDDVDMEGEDITGDYDPHAYDRDVLLQQDYTEKLIHDSSVLRKSALSSSRKKGKGKKSVGFDVATSGSYRKLKDADISPEGESESEVELDAESHLKYLKKRQRRKSCLKSCCFFLVCLLVIGIVGAAGYIAVIKHKFGISSLNPFRNSSGSEVSTTTNSTSKAVLSNGTHDFYPTTIFISLDGFRPDYLTPEYTPTMWEMYSSEYMAPFMYPSFPSVTFPNHYTLVTGLYPSSHGIVGNTFYDPDLQEEFNYHDPSHSIQSKWWGGEPLWVTASKSGVRSAIHMWPGSEAPWGDYTPEFVDKYNGSETLDRKAKRVLGWLDMEVDERPELILCYVPTIDTLGHKYGTLGPEIDSGLSQVDSLIGSIFQGIDDRNLSSVVNVVIVSDHGMASTSNDRLIFLDDLIAPDSVEHTDGWPLFGLRPYSYNTTNQIYSEIVDSREEIKTLGTNETEGLDHWEVYKRDSMPEEWHFGGPSGGKYQDRIAPVWILPEAGWAISTKARFARQNYDFKPKGLHGFNNTHPLMRALFLASGPHFPSGFQAEPFYNTEVYDIICASLNITGADTNGTLGGEPNALPDGWMDPVQFPTYIPNYVASSTSSSAALPSATANPAEVDADNSLDGGSSITDEAGNDDEALDYIADKLDSVTVDINSWLDGMSDGDSDNV